MREVSILFAGDFAPCRRYEALVHREQLGVFGGASEYVNSADVAFVNLECPLTSHDQAIAKSGPALKASASTAVALAKAGFTVAGLANNHAMDFGLEGLRATLSACDAAGLPVVGAGLTLDQAQRPFVAEVNGARIAIIALAEHEFNQSENGGPGTAPVDPIDNLRQIRDAKEQAEVVIVTLHGGNEYFPYPRPGMRKLCHFYIDQGADAVVCHHPHVPGAYEYHRGKPILYSLGNFIFDVAEPPEDWELGYMASLKFDSAGGDFLNLELVPYRQSVEIGGVVLLEGSEKAAFLERVEQMRRNLEDPARWLKEWSSLVEKRADRYLRRLYYPRHFRGLGLLWRWGRLTDRFFNKSNGLAKLNVIRCQSHRELLQASMEFKIQNSAD